MDSQSQNKKNYSEKRIDRACQYVSDLWFPANPALVARLHAAIKTDRYNSDIDSLISEIQGDYSLYMFCLKELYRLLREDGVEPPPFKSALDLFRFGGIEKLRTILSISEQQVSAHSFDGMSESQRRRLEESIVSASSAQVLAKHSQIDPSLGYSTGLLRQLGLTLIAWNYPSVYEKALAALDENTSLDVAISQILGFSPSVLAVAMAHKWGLPPELCAALEGGPENAEEVTDLLEVEAVGSMLANLCRIGEALARANNPQDYPSARKDWVKAQAEIVSRLGPNGVSVIQGAVAENCQQYTLSTPNFFRPGAILDPETHITSHVQGKLLASNPFVDRCSPLMRRKLTALYESIARMVSCEDAVHFLIREIIASSGFTGGAVYTIEPSTSLLVPQLRILRIETRGMEPVPSAADTAEADVVTLAYQCDEPIVKNEVTKGQAVYACISGLFGFAQRVGVLYLEIPQLVFDARRDMHLTNFRAFAQALNDSLELR